MIYNYHSVGQSDHFLFTSESVNEGHPDKLCDQISDTILDACLEQDPESKVACEVCTKRGLVMVFGQITTKAKVNYEEVVRNVVHNVGYDSEDKVIINLEQQSQEIAQAVHLGKDIDETCAGDQGIMFGYATDETPEYMPLSHSLASALGKRLRDVRLSNLLPYLGPDGKTQITVEYIKESYGIIKPIRVHTVLISQQHSSDVSNETLRNDLMTHVIKPVIPSHLLDDKTIYYLNPSGRFVIGGPTSDAGLTGRKLIADTYGGWGAHGGGCFSGKDGTKVDRSAAYYARKVAKSLVANGFCRRALVQVSYSIGIRSPLSLYVDSYNTCIEGFNDYDLEQIAVRNFDFSVGNIIKELELKKPIYSKSGIFGHFGKDNPEYLWERVKDLSHELKNKSKI